MLEILMLNPIARVGLERLPSERYRVARESSEPAAILVRSADMHSMQIPASVVAVGRAGAGTNNIPVAALSVRGVPVFNAPGANANAVKELVLSGLLMAARNLAPAMEFVRSLAGESDDAALARRVEDGKKAFAGLELPGRRLGVVGLGKVGSLVADACLKLGMEVLGYDPEITVEAAWSLSSQVKKAHSIEEILRSSEFVTLHVPLLKATRHLVDSARLALMQPGSILLNFARDEIVDAAAVAAALDSGRLKSYVTDFPVSALAGRPGVIALPHLGASTREAEDNCAVMVVEELRDFLEDGNIRNAVNFPEVVMARESPWRVAVANANVPNMLGQISSAMAGAGLNIHNMINRSRGEMAYTLVDVDSPVGEPLIGAIRGVRGVLAVRYLPGRG